MESMRLRNSWERVLQRFNTYFYTDVQLLQAQLLIRLADVHLGMAFR